jgi:hypothetical protein
MTARRQNGRFGLRSSTTVVAVLLTLVDGAGSLHGQTTAENGVPILLPGLDVANVDGEIVQAGCTSCGNGGGGVLRTPPSGDLAGSGGGCCGGANPPCLGQQPCYEFYADNCFKRLCYCLYQCICCPDPCYEGRWIPLADAAFFVESARPQTSQRLRWDYHARAVLLDRAEYLWSQQGPPGRGPLPPLPFAFAQPRASFNDLSLYTEVAASKISFFVEIPYRSIEPSLKPIVVPTIGHAAGFSDMNLGTKTLLYDCELLQLGFIFRTYVPVGNPFKGLGNGHVSLEPSLLLDVKLSPDCYFQGQLSEWIPIGGTPGYQGAILHYHVSFNQVLYRLVPNVPLIGTLEMSGWSFQTGSYTDPSLGPYQPAGGETYVSAGPGIRLFVCDYIDFGVGSHFSLTEHHWGNPIIRSEFRWRF